MLNQPHRRETADTLATPSSDREASGNREAVGDREAAGDG